MSLVHLEVCDVGTCSSILSTHRLCMGGTQPLPSKTLGRFLSAFPMHAPLFVTLYCVSHGCVSFCPKGPGNRLSHECGKLHHGSEKLMNVAGWVINMTDCSQM